MSAVQKRIMHSKINDVVDDEWTINKYGKSKAKSTVCIKSNQRNNRGWLMLVFILRHIQFFPPSSNSMSSYLTPYTFLLFESIHNIILDFHYYSLPEMMFISYEGESHSHSHSSKHKSLMYECATASSSQMLFHKYQVIVWCIVEYIKTSPNAIRVELNCTSREKKKIKANRVG